MEKEAKRFLIFLSIAVFAIIYLSFFIELTDSAVISHKDITGTDLHIPKTHQSSHGPGDTDEITALGDVAADGLTLDEDETINWSPADTADESIHWDSVTHDYRMSDDLYLEDNHPGLVWSNTDSSTGFALHYHYGTAYPFALFYGTIDGDGGFHVSGMGVPLMYTTESYVYFPKGVGGNINTPDIKIGTTQAAAGATTGDLWVDTDDNYIVKLGQ